MESSNTNQPSIFQRIWSGLKAYLTDWKNLLGHALLGVAHELQERRRVEIAAGGGHHLEAIERRELTRAARRGTATGAASRQ